METLQKTSTWHGQAAMQHPLVSVVMPASISDIDQLGSVGY